MKLLGGIALLVMATTITSNVAYGQLARGDRYSGAAWATRSPVLAQHGMAATEQPLASQIAIDVLKKAAARSTPRLPPMRPSD